MALMANGMDNRQANHALPEGKARNLVNTDVDNSGRNRRRKGCAKVYDALSAQGGFDIAGQAFFISAGSLMQFDPGGSHTTLITGVRGPVAHCEVAGTIYLSDGTKTWKLIDGIAVEWGISPPAAPLLASGSGSFPAGRYLAAISWVDSNGVESGASPVSMIETSVTGSIIFRNLPRSDYTLRLYLGVANGSTLYHVADTAAIEYTVSAVYDNANVLDLRDVYPPMPATMLCLYNGRIYNALGAIVAYSEPFQFDHYKRGENYLAFPADCTLMEPVTAGIYFATADKTWFYMGSPEDGFQIFEKFDYGAIPGTAVRNDDGSVVWQSQRGMVMATPDGQAQNVQEKNVATDSAVSGAGLLIERNGLRQFVASLKQPTASPLAATSWIDAEVIRRGA